MAGQLIVDLTAYRRVSVEMRLGSEFPDGATGEWYGLVRTLDAEMSKEQPWHLEAYLRLPFIMSENTDPARWASAPPEAMHSGQGCTPASVTSHPCQRLLRTVSTSGATAAHRFAVQRAGQHVAITFHQQGGPGTSRTGDPRMVMALGAPPRVALVHRVTIGFFTIMGAQSPRLSVIFPGGM
jgi:hypothetical protein